MALFNMLAQIIAALVIFVLGYIALLFSAIGAVLLSMLAYKAGRMLWLRVNARTASATPGAAPRKVGLLADHAEPARTPSL